VTVRPNGPALTGAVPHGIEYRTQSTAARGAASGAAPELGGASQPLTVTELEALAIGHACERAR
jgi:hypothetical protein